MGALIMFNLMRTNFNELTTADNFMLIKTSIAIEKFLYPAYLISVFFIVRIWLEINTRENYDKFIKDLPKTENGRFSEGPLFGMVLWAGAIVIAIMILYFALYVCYKRKILKNRVIEKFELAA